MPENSNIQVSQTIAGSLCGYVKVCSNYHFEITVHPRHHIYMVYPVYGYGLYFSSVHCVRIEHHRYHI